MTINESNSVVGSFAFTPETNRAEVCLSAEPDSPVQDAVQWLILKFLCAIN